MAVLDVLILGGGVAGLRATIALAAAGRRVALLEGRDRLGGRIDTRHEPGWPPIEAGAEFVHGRPPVIERLRRRLGARLLEHEQRHLVFDRRGQRQGNRVWEQAMALMERLPGQPPDRSYAQLERERWWRLLAGPPVRALARAFIEGFNATDASAIGVVALAEQTRASAEIDGDRLFRIEGGYGRLVEGLLAEAVRRGVEVRTGAEVTAVHWRPGRVQVHARAPLGERLAVLTARAAVVALPLGVLQARPPARAAVRFLPRLPDDKREAIARLGFGPVLRLALRFGADVPGVGRSDASFLHVVSAAFPTFWRLQPAAGPLGPTLIGWAAGPAVRRLSRGGVADPERCLRAGLASLAAGLQVPTVVLRAGLQGWRLFDWQRDPFARGAYSFAPPGGARLPNQLAAPVQGTLFFAGEAANTGGATGTVHGAMDSGDRAARLVLDSLPPKLQQIRGRRS
jgi:hypothetical protein